MNDGEGPLTVPQTFLPPKRLIHANDDGVSPSDTQPMQPTETAARDDEKLSLATFDLHDKPVSTF